MPPHHSQIQYQHVRQIAGALIEYMGRYGYELADLPIIEAAGLFLTKAGDQIIQKLFTFERHGQELALRPEFTAPAAYYYVTNQAPESVARWQFSGPVFEDDPRQLERKYQHFSAGAELLGMAGPHAEAEIIAMAANGLNLLGISDCQLLIGHAGLTRQLLARFNLDSRTQRFLLSHLTLINDRGKAYVLEQLDNSYMPSNVRSFVADDKPGSPDTQQALHMLLNTTNDHIAAMGGRSREDIARRLLQKRRQALEHTVIEAALDFLEQWVNISASPTDGFAAIEQMIQADNTARPTLDEWHTVIDLLAVYEIPRERVVIQPALARSWEYYSGIVFELRTGSGLHLGGGGRYDELPRLIGGQHEVPAVGFAYYIDEMLTAIPSDSTLLHTVLYIELDDNNGSAAVRWAEQLRSHAVAVAICPGDKLKEGQHRLLVNPDDTANFRQQSYTLTQVESLVADLNETKYVR